MIEEVLFSLLGSITSLALSFLLAAKHGVIKLTPAVLRLRRGLFERLVFDRGTAVSSKQRAEHA